MATRSPRLPAPLPEQLPHLRRLPLPVLVGPVPGGEGRDGPWVVRDPEGALVARARTRWTAARWACAQRRGEDGAS